MKQVWLLILLVLATSVIAEERVSFRVTPQEITIKANQTAVFNISIKHHNTQAEPYDLFSGDVLWDLRTDDTLVVPPEGLKTKLNIRPLFNKPGVYGIPLTLRRLRTGEIFRKPITIEVLSNELPLQSYLPSIKGQAHIDRGINPETPTEITVEVESKNSVTIPKLVIKARSHSLNADHTTTLNPYEKKTITFTVQLDPKTPPQEDLLRTTIIAFDKNGKSYTFDANAQVFEIVPYGRVVEQVRHETSFLKKFTTITLTNEGNVGRVKEYNYHTGFFKSVFTSAQPKGIREGTSLQWDVPLETGESRQIVITTNYWPLFILAVILIVLAIGYYTFRSPLVLTKSARIVSTKEGGISELKILLSVYNRTKKPIKNVRIIDLVPKISEYITKTDPGSLEPHSVVTHEKKGSILKWRIATLEPSEERIIVYRMKARFAIIGGVRLPVASVKFEFMQGHERTTNSNIAVINL